MKKISVYQSPVMKTTLIFAFSILFATGLSAQGISSYGGKLGIGSTYREVKALSGNILKYGAASVVVVNGDFYNNESATVTLTGKLKLIGNLTKDSGTGSVLCTNAGSYSVVEFAGSSLQSVGGTSTGSFDFYKVVINNSSGGVLANQSISVKNNLDFQKGLLSTAGSGQIKVLATASITNVATDKYVDGKLYLQYTSLGSKLFPIGKGGNYRPITVGTTSVASMGIVAEQIEGKMPGTAPANTKMFDARYWTITLVGVTKADFKVSLNPIGFTPASTPAIISGDGTTNITNPSTTPNYTNLTAFNTSGLFGLGDLSCNSPTSGGTIGTAQTICSGTAPASFTSTTDASGQLGTIEYKWQSSTTSATSNFSDIASSNSATYSPAAINASTWYKRVARVSCKPNWTGAVESNVIAMTVIPASKGGTLAGSVSVCNGTNSTNLTLSGYTGTILKWQSTTDNWVNSINIDNTTTTLTTTNLTATTKYRAVVQSGACATANSSEAVITVSPETVGGTIGGSATVCATLNSTKLTLSGHTGNVLKWQSSTNDWVTSTNIANTSSTLTIDDLAITTKYRAVLQSGVCAAANSAEAVITVNPETVGGTIVGSASVCSGINSTDLSLTGNVGDVVKWQSSTNNWSTVVDVNNTSTMLTINNLITTTKYRAVIKSGICDQVNSAVATLTVSAVTVGGSIAGSTSVYAGTNSTLLTLSGQTGSVIKWQSSTNDWTTATDIVNTTTTFTATNLTVATKYRAIVQSGVCDTEYSEEAELKIKALPEVTSVTVAEEKTYAIGQTIYFTVNYSDPVTVNGTPTLSLTPDSGTKNASYYSGSGTSSPVFMCTVVSGDTDINGVALGSSVALNGGTINNSDNQPAKLVLNNISSMTNVLVDGVRPAVTSVDVPTNAIYIAGQNLDFTVNFDEAVKVETSGGTPYISVTMDSGSAQAAYLGGSGTASLTFRYSVVSGNNDSNGISLGSSIVANSGTLKDAAGNDVVLTINNASSTTGVLVDATIPTISSVSSSAANSTYIPGNTISIVVNFSEAVVVTGTPKLALNSGGSASYSSGSNSTALTFSYTVASGQTSADLDYSSTSALTLEGGTIADAGTNPATLTLPTPGGTGSLGANKSIVVGYAPTVTTQAVSGIADIAAAGNGTITNLGFPNPTEYGVCWSTSTNPTISDSKTSKGTATSTGAFIAYLSNLEPVTTYYVKAFATNSAGTVYGEEVTFTSAVDKNLLDNPGAESDYSSWTKTDGGSGWAVINDASGAYRGSKYWASSYNQCILKQEVVLSTKGYTDADLDKCVPIDAGAFVKTYSGFGGPAYIRVELLNGSGTVLGNYYDIFNETLAANLSWTSKKILISGYPTGVRKIRYAIYANSSSNWLGQYGPRFDETSLRFNQGACANPTTGGTIGAAQTICGNLSPSGLTSISAASGQTGTIEYMWQSSTDGSNWYDISSSNSTTYSPGALSMTTWYKRLSRVLCSDGWVGAAESNAVKITVLQASVGGAATAALSSVLSGSTTSISLSGNTETIQWQQSATGTGGWDNVTGGSGATTATYTTPALSANTWYRGAITTNNCAVAYSTVAEVDIFSLTTTTITGIGSTTASGGGTLSGTGASSITERGICWSTSESPTIAGTHTSDGSGTGSYSSSITGLTTGTKYYVRAYATNSAGTVYGSQVSFTPFVLGTFSNINKTFGDAAFELKNPTSAGSGAFSYISSNTGVATISGNTVTIVGAGETTITSNQAAATPYAAASTSATLTVAKARQKISLSVPTTDKLNTFISSLLEITATSSNGLPVTITKDASSTAPATFSFVSAGVYSLTGVAGVGTLTFVARQAGDDNYLPATDVTQSFDVTKGNQHISFESFPDGTYGGADFTVVAYGGGSNLPVTFISMDPTIASCSGTNGATITPNKAGKCTITVSQAGDENWNAATDVDRIVTIFKATPTITFSNFSKSYGDASFDLPLSGPNPTSLSTGAFSFSSASTDVATVGGNGITMTVGAIGTSVITATQAADDNYLTASNTATLTVGTKALTVTGATVTTKQYNGNNSATIIGATLSGVVGSDEVTLSNATSGSFAQTTVGTGISVTTGMTLAGANANKYTLLQPTLSGSITAKPLTVEEASVTSKIYDGNTNAVITGGSLVGIVGTDNVSLSATKTGSFAQTTVGTGLTVTPALTLTGTMASNYSLTQPVITGSITQKELTVIGATVTSKVYDKITAATITGATLSGKISGDEVNLGNTTTGTFAQSTVGTEITVTTTPMTISGANAGNYTIAQPVLKGAITPKELTVTSASVTTKIYNGNTTATITGAVLSGIISSDVVTLGNKTSGLFDNANIGTGKPVTTSMTITGTNAANYTLSQPSPTGAITAKGLVITATNKSKSYGTAYSNFSYSISGLVSGDTRPTVSYECVGAAATATVANSPYTITASNAEGSGLSNYDISYIAGSLVVEQKQLSIIAADRSKVYGSGASFNATYPSSDFSVSGLVNGDILTRIRLESSGAAPSALASSTPYAITASAAEGTGLANYSFSYTDGGLTVTTKELTIKPTDKSKIYGQSFTFTGDYPADFTVTGLVNEDAVTSITTASEGGVSTAPVGGSPYYITGSNASGSGLSNYSISYDYGLLTVTTKELTVTGAAVTSKQYDGNTDAAITGATLSGVANGDEVTLENATSGVFAQSTLGTAIPVTTSMSISGSGAGNYTLTQPDLRGNITARELIVTGALVTAKMYDGNTKAEITGATLSGVLESEVVNLDNASAGIFASPKVGSNISVSTSMSISGTNASNYTIVQPVISGDITAKELIVINALVTTKVYDRNTDATVTGATLTGIVSPDVVILENISTGTFDLASAGTNIGVATAMSLSGADAANYVLVQPVLSGEITAKELTVNTTTVNSKIYDGNTKAVLVGSTLAGVLSPDDVSMENSETGYFDNANAGVGKRVTSAMNLTGADAGNYRLTLPEMTGSISKAMLSVSADQKTKSYGSVNPALTATYSGWQGQDDSSMLTSKPIITTTVTAASVVGVYPGAISIGGASDENYDFTYSPADFTVVKAALTVTADFKVKAYGAAMPVLTFTYSGWQNQENSSVLTVEPTVSATVTIDSNADIYYDDITVSGGEDENYMFVYLPAYFVVTKAVLTVAAQAKTKVYGSANQELTFTYSGWANGENLSALTSLPIVNTTVTSTSDVGVHAGAITVSGGIAQNYDFQYKKADFSVTPKAITAAITAADKCFDGTTAATVRDKSLSGVIAPDQVSLVVGNITFVSPGSGIVKAVKATELSLSGVKATNYELTNSEVFTTASIFDLPVVTLTGSTLVCAGSSGVTYTTESGMGSYVWTISQGGTISLGAGTNQIRVTWNEAGAQKVGVSYSNQNGCTPTTASTISVRVNPLVGSAGAISGSTSLCTGSQGVGYSVATIDNATNYTWSVPEGATIATGAGTASITVNFSSTAISGAVTVYGSNDCGKGSSSSRSVTVMPRVAAAGSITGPNAVCSGAKSLIFSVAPIAEATSYSWNIPVGSTIVSGAGTRNIVLDLSELAITSQITVYGINSCGAGAASPSFTLTINPIPVTPVVVVQGTALMSSSAQCNQWYFSAIKSGVGTAIAGATSQSFIPTANGWYWTQVILNGCDSGLSNELYRLKAGEDNLYNVYPVPNHGLFTVNIKTPDEQEFTIVVYDQLGQKIYELPGVMVNGEFTQEINLPNTSTGVYSIIFRSKDGNVIKKFNINK